MVKLTVVLDQPKAWFFGGDVVSGKCIVETPGPFQTRSLHVELVGVERAHVQETEVEIEPEFGKSISFKPKLKTKVYKANRRILALGKVLVGCGWSKRAQGAKVQLNGGTHEYPFQLRLPATLLPSGTFLGEFPDLGEIEYTLTAYLDNSSSALSFNKTQSMKLTMGGFSQPLASLHALRQSSAAFSRRAAKSFLLSGKDETLQVTARLPRKAFFKGEQVSVEVAVNNRSTKDIKSIELELKSERSLQACGKTFTGTSTTNFASDSVAIPAGGSVSHTCSAKLPSPQETSVESRHITCRFFILVHVIPKALFATRLTIALPITLLRYRKGGLPSLPSAGSSAATAAAAATPATTTTTTQAIPSAVSQKRYQYKNGDVYQGDWANNKAHGRGTMTYANGNIFVGVWNHGTIVDGRFIPQDANAQYEEPGDDEASAAAAAAAGGAVFTQPLSDSLATLGSQCSPALAELLAADPEAQFIAFPRVQAVEKQLAVHKVAVDDVPAIFDDFAALSAAMADPAAHADIRAKFHALFPRLCLAMCE